MANEVSSNAIRRAARRHAFQELARKHKDEFRAIYEREVKKAGLTVSKPKAAKPKAKRTATAKAKAA